MLDAAFGNWIETLEERDFDDTFVALLRASGFYDIHFTHGGFEFGKDFIAKRRGAPPHQYAFQCKAGDIGGSEWDRIFAQLYQLAGVRQAHPSFDASLPRVFVLVTTGRLTGKAIQCASDFANDLTEHSRGRFEVWGNPQLREMLRGTDAQLPPSPELLPVLARVSGGGIEDNALESLLAPLVPAPEADDGRFHRALLDNAIVTATLARAGLVFHALTATLNAVRITATRAHHSPGEASFVREALSSYTRTGERLLRPLLTAPEDERIWLQWCGGVTGTILSYPATCLRMMEFLGLSALCDTQRRSEWVRTLAQVVERQPGAVRPISDRYASCIAPAVIALATQGHGPIASTLLKRTTLWVCDQYERSEFGLADAYASAKIEAETLLCAAFEFATLRRRRDSLLAVALADLAREFAPALYSDIVDELFAVDIQPSAVHALDLVSAYRVGTGAIESYVNIRYPNDLSSALPHHPPGAPRALQLASVPEALLAIACLTRDRLFSDCYRSFRESA